jgi:hypothetical protein
VIVEALATMHAGELATAGFGVAATIATFVIWAVQGTPPESDDRPIERTTPSEMFYAGEDRPAGPDAESGLPGLEANPNEF